mmetsp:Transcript_102003/g.227852  ORF Transcript_102003/g.227852 Transcript_102003/m.227852 type:complete len:354 (-) Transcript_102003:143-1204(-)
MGQSVSVDAELIELRDLLRLGQALVPASKSETPVHPPLLQHHLKAWKFESRGPPGPVVVDFPVVLCDEHGLLDAALLRRNCCYLILHVWTAATSAGAKETLAASAAVAALLQDVASHAAGVFTPRGLTSPLTSVAESSQTGSLRYGLFAWNGLDAEPRVRARLFAKAFELQRLLRLGLLLERSVLDSLTGAVALKSHAWHHSMAEPLGTGVAAAAASEDVRRSKNRLLTAILDGPMAERRAVARPLAKHIGGAESLQSLAREGSATTQGCSVATGRRFPCVARTVWSSLHGLRAAGESGGPAIRSSGGCSAGSPADLAAGPPDAEDDDESEESEDSEDEEEEEEDELSWKFRA